MKRIDLKGIVRATSPQNNADGNCEEIVNLRQDTGVWRPVGKKKVIVSEVDYEQVYVHKYSTFENYIGVKDGRVIWFASVEEGGIVRRDREVCRVVGTVVISSLMNILLVRDDRNIAKVLFTGAYQVSTVEMPDVPIIEIKREYKEYKKKSYTHINYNSNKTEDVEAAKETVKGLLNREKSEDLEYTEGYVFLCATYQLFDGSETKPTPPVMVKLGEYVKGVMETKNPNLITDKYEADIRVGDMKLQNLMVNVSSPVTAEHKETVTKINVYATLAFSFYDLESINLRVSLDGYIVDIDECRPRKKDMEKMLFYRVAEFEALHPTGIFTTVKFDNSFTANRTMPVDASGWLNTTGDMFCYNNRLHLYNVWQRFTKGDNLQKKYLSHPEGDTDLVLLCYLKNSYGETVVRCDVKAKQVSPRSYLLNSFISFPDSRCKRMEVYHPRYACSPFKINMIESLAYNFVFCDDLQLTVNIDVNPEMRAEIPEERLTRENAKIVVSEATNPYYFPPEHSYLMPGEILNMGVNTEQISASQIGMFPLYVFTTEGIYALQVGEGKTLYSNVIPVSAEVIVKGCSVLQTKYGIVFVTEAGLKLISGVSVVDLSQPIKGSVDMTLRNEEFKLRFDHDQLCHNLQYLSCIPFVEYIRTAKMGYDISHDELIISDHNREYTYVYNLETKTWHKITEKFAAFERHIGLVNKVKEIPAVPATATIWFTFTGKPVAGEEIGVSIGPNKFTYTVKNGDSGISVIAALAVEIRKRYTAKSTSASIVVSADPGVAGNGTVMEVFNSEHIFMDGDKFAGGADAYGVPVIDVCDIRMEEKCALPVYLQTRPICMDTYGFKTISHATLRGETYPDGKYYGVYIFASNDLVNWKAVSSRYVDTYMTGIPMNRTHNSFRYFVMAAGGEVKPESSVSCFEVDDDRKWDNHLR